MNNIRAATDLEHLVGLLNEVAASDRAPGAQKKYLCITPKGTLTVQSKKKGIVCGKLNQKTITNIALKQLETASHVSDHMQNPEEFARHATDISKVLLQLNTERDAKRQSYRTARTVLTVALVILSCFIVGIPFLYKLYSDGKKFEKEQRILIGIANNLKMTKKIDFSFSNQNFDRNPRKEILRQLKSPTLTGQLVTLKNLDEPPVVVSHAVKEDTLRYPSIVVKFQTGEVAYKQPNDKDEKEKEVTNYFIQLYKELGALFPQSSKAAHDAAFTNLTVLHTQEAVAEEVEHLQATLGRHYVSVKALKKSELDPEIQKDDSAATNSIKIMMGPKGMHSRIHTLCKLSAVDGSSPPTPTGEEAYVVNTLDRIVPWDVLSIPSRHLKKTHMHSITCTGRYSSIFSTEAEAVSHMQKVMSDQS